MVRIPKAQLLQKGGPGSGPRRGVPRGPYKKRGVAASGETDAKAPVNPPPILARFTLQEFTDNSGIVHKRPKRTDFESDIEWLRADNAFNDKMSSIANAAFDRAFRAKD